MDEVFKTVQDMFAKDMMGDAKYLFTHSYIEDVKFLLNKYGAAKYDYFCDESMKSKNSKSSRTKEGLFCHHIYEYKYPLICNPIVAQKYPFEIQKKENLCYCNILEHLILHIKIDDEYRNHDYSCGTRVISQTISKFLASDINSSLLFWEQNCKRELIKDMDNIINLSSLLGYLMVIERLIGNKEVSFERCKIINDKRYLCTMLDLCREPLNKWKYCYKSKCNDGVFTFYGAINKALDYISNRLYYEYTNINHLKDLYNKKENVSFNDLKRSECCWDCKYFCHYNQYSRTFKKRKEGLCLCDNKRTNINNTCQYFERRDNT